MQNKKSSQENEDRQIQKENALQQKESILQQLKENGCRITGQRKILLDIILEGNCSCCKEIYYKARKADEKIGSATVYRMMNMLEEIGVINRRNMYHISCENPCEDSCEKKSGCTVEFDDGKIFRLNHEDWKDVMQAGLKTCGYIQNQKIKNVIMHSCYKQEKE